MQVKRGSERRRVLALTGIRSEYDILYSALKAIKANRQLELGVAVAGAHCSDMFGRSERLVEADGFMIVERMETLLNSNTLGGRVKSAAIELQGFVQAVERYRPDFILVAGDREESLVGAMCGAYMNIPVAHMCGGDCTTGNTDDSVRHAVTRLAHVHFPMSRKSALRLKAMGEEKWRIHCTGNPALDRFRTVKKVERGSLFRKLGFTDIKGPYAVVIQHAVSSQSGRGYEQMRATLDGIGKAGIGGIVIYPNSDAGNQDVIRAIEEKQRCCPWLRVSRNLPREEFVNLMRHASVLVGNSSMGIVEAPTLRLPVVNAGSRQAGREHACNVIFTGHDADEIAFAVERCLKDRRFMARVKKCVNPYGDGHAGERIAKVLAGIETGPRLINKIWTC